MVYWYFIPDSILRISLENTSNKPVSLPDDFYVAYEEDHSMVYFNTWYVTKDSLKKYNKYWSDIGYVIDPITGEVGRPRNQIILNPGENTTWYDHPFTKNGHCDTPGYHRLQVVYKFENKKIESNYTDLYFAANDTFFRFDKAKLLTLASGYLNKGKYYHAAAIYYLLINKHGSQPEWWYQRAACASYVGQHGLAAWWFGISAEKDTANIAYQLKHAEALVVNKEFDNAIKEYKKLLRRQNIPDSVKSKLPALITLTQKQQKEADANDPRKLESLAEEYMRGWDYNAAIALYNKLERVTEPHRRGFVYSDRAFCHYKFAVYEAALKDYDKAIALLPDLAINYFYRGMVHFELNKMNEACADYAKATKLLKYDMSFYEDVIKSALKSEVDYLKVKNRCMD